MTESRSNEKITIFDGTHAAWPAASNKLVADSMTEDIQWVLWIAATLKPSDPAIQLKNQAKFYGCLVKSIADNCSEIVSRVPPTTLNPWTTLWNVLLDQYQNSANIAKEHTIINLANFCLSFKGCKWSMYYRGAERLINLFKSTTSDSKLTVDYMAMAMMLQGMILAGGHWSTLATMMLTDEKLNLETLHARAYNHSVNFSLENGVNIEVNNLDSDTQSQASMTTTGSTQDNKSDKDLDMNILCKMIWCKVIEALATDGAARGNANSCKGFWLHGTVKHTPANCNLLKMLREKDLCLKCSSDDGHRASD
eukprot:2765955-Rhodomonas_salina.1